MSRKGYSMHEKKLILNYLLDRAAFNEVKGRKIWVDLAKTDITTRTWQSLKEVFVKRIMPDIQNPYYKLTNEEIHQFRRGSNSSYNTIEWIKKNSVLDDDDFINTSIKDDKSYNSDRVIYITDDNTNLPNNNNTSTPDKRPLKDINPTDTESYLNSPKLSNMYLVNGNKEGCNSRTSPLDDNNTSVKSAIQDSTTSTDMNDDNEPNVVNKSYSNLPPSNRQSNAKTSNNDNDVILIKESDGRLIEHSKSKRDLTEKMFGFSAGQTNVIERKRKQAIEYQVESRKSRHRFFNDRNSNRFREHYTSTESVIGSNDSRKFDNSDSDSSSSSIFPKQNSKGQPMFAVYNDKLYPLYVGDPNDPKHLPRCYMKEKYTTYSKNVVSQKPKKNREFETKSPAEKFCCINLERLYFNHLLRYVDDGNLGPKPNVRDYLNIPNSPNFEHSEGCTNTHPKPKRYSDQSLDDNNYGRSINVGSKRTLQMITGFPNDEMERRYYRDLERYYNTSGPRLKPKKEAYQRISTEDDAKHRKYNVHNMGKPREKNISTTYIDDNDCTINNLHFQTNITKRTDNQINVTGDQMSANKSSDYWKTKYLTEKAKNDMICRMISAGCDQHTMVKALTMENPESALTMGKKDKRNECKETVQDRSGNEKKNNESQISSTGIAATPSTSKGPAKTNENGGEIAEMKISVSKGGEDPVNVYHLKTENATLIIDMFNKLHKDQNSKSLTVEEQVEEEEQVKEAEISPKTNNKNGTISDNEVATITDKEESTENVLSRSRVDEKEKEIFDAIFADNKSTDNSKTERKIFSSSELNMWLNEESTKNGSSKKKKRNSKTDPQKSTASTSTDAVKTTKPTVPSTENKIVDNESSVKKTSDEVLLITSSENNAENRKKKNNELTNLVIDCVESSFKTDGRRRSTKISPTKSNVESRDVKKTNTKENEPVKNQDSVDQSFFKAKFMFPDTAEQVIISSGSDTDHFKINEKKESEPVAKKKKSGLKNDSPASKKKSKKKRTKIQNSCEDHNASFNNDLLVSQGILVKYDMTQEHCLDRIMEDSTSDSIISLVKYENIMEIADSSTENTYIDYNSFTLSKSNISGDRNDFPAYEPSLHDAPNPNYLDDWHGINPDDQIADNESPNHNDILALPKSLNDMINMVNLDKFIETNYEQQIENHNGIHKSRKPTSNWHLFSNSSSLESALNSPENSAIKKKSRKKFNMIKKIKRINDGINSIEEQTVTVNQSETSNENPEYFSDDKKSSFVDQEFDIMKEIMSEESS